MITEDKLNTEALSESLIIKNFGPIKDINLDLKNSTLFIGPQGSGKSTIAKLIAIFRDYKFLFKETIELDFFNKYNIKNYFINSSNNQNSTSQGTYLEYNSRHYKIVFDNNEFSITKNNLFESALDKEEQRFEKVISENIKLSKDSKSDRQNKILFKRFLREKELFSPIFLQLIRDSIYIPTERLLTSLISESPFGFLTSGISLPEFLTDFGTLFEQARRAISDFSVNFLKIRYRFQQSENRIFFENKKFIKLSESASGFQAIIPILLVLEYLCKNISVGYSFVVEEPELNLFPTTQKFLINFLVSKCTKNKNELIITTHSPYVLSSFTNLLFAYEVASKYPEKEKEIEKIIPKDSWLDPNIFNAYYIADGNAKPIFNKETDLIGENELDQVSDIIGDEYDKLMQIYRQK